MSKSYHSLVKAIIGGFKKVFYYILGRLGRQIGKYIVNTRVVGWDRGWDRVRHAMEAVSVRWSGKSLAGRSPPQSTCQILTSSFQSGRSCVGRGRPFFIENLQRGATPPSRWSWYPRRVCRQADGDRPKTCQPAKHARKHCPPTFVFCAKNEHCPPNMPKVQNFVGLARPHFLRRTVSLSTCLF